MLFAMSAPRRLFKALDVQLTEVDGLLDLDHLAGNTVDRAEAVGKTSRCSAHWSIRPENISGFQLTAYRALANDVDELVMDVVEKRQRMLLLAAVLRREDQEPLVLASGQQRRSTPVCPSRR